MISSAIWKKRVSFSKASKPQNSISPTSGRRFFFQNCTRTTNNHFSERQKSKQCILILYKDFNPVFHFLHCITLYFFCTVLHYNDTFLDQSECSNFLIYIIIEYKCQYYACSLQFYSFLFLGCSGPGPNPFLTGEQYVDDQCTRICTCNETGRFACLALCPTTPHINTECAVPLVPRKTRVPVGPAKYRCHCQQIICEKPRMYFAVISEFVRSFRIFVSGQTYCLR